MGYRLYDFLEQRGDHCVNVVKEWTEGLQKRDRARLNQKLDMLEREGTNLSYTLLSDTGAPGIKKLRITGRKVLTLRPMLCRGPIDNDSEFTLLVGAIEKDRALIPSSAVERAVTNRDVLLKNPSQRCPHERVS